MTRWIAEWLLLSLAALVLVGMGLVLWALWPVLPAQMEGGALSLDGVVAIAMLAIVGLGFLKLMVGR